MRGSSPRALGRGDPAPSENREMLKTTFRSQGRGRRELYSVRYRPIAKAGSAIRKEVVLIRSGGVLSRHGYNLRSRR